MEKKKSGLMIAVMGADKPPKLGAPGEKKAAPPFGAKHETAETPAYEAQEESAKEKLAYIRAALKDLLSVCDEGEEPEEEMGGEEEVEA